MLYSDIVSCKKVAKYLKDKSHIAMIIHQIAFPSKQINVAMFQFARNYGATLPIKHDVLHLIADRIEDYLAASCHMLQSERLHHG